MDLSVSESGDFFYKIPKTMMGDKEDGESKDSLNDQSTVSQWLSTIKHDDIGGLAADLDCSLSGLGVDLGSLTGGAYNMSEALLALPVFKQEVLDSGFQYILCAATSPAQKINEETLTYLNQGQPYETKLKKIGDLGELRNKTLRTIVRVLFHDRRLQFTEQEQMQQWKMTRPGERILELDNPLSYGIQNPKVDSSKLNQVEFTWEPTMDTGVYLKVHCISTEFTPKKHGGEKGVPFRLQVETYLDEPGESTLLHCGSCQVKVFKPKGADRKHKTDREKMEKRPSAEKEKFQPSYECTVLTEIPVDQALKSLEQMKMQDCMMDVKPETKSDTVANFLDVKLSLNETIKPKAVPKPAPVSPTATPAATLMTSDITRLEPDATALEAADWLKENRFGNYVKVFQNFTGSDLLRMTREDLIQICGIADGIRLENTLQSKVVRPKLTVYICQLRSEKETAQTASHVRVPTPEPASSQTSPSSSVMDECASPASNMSTESNGVPSPSPQEIKVQNLAVTADGRVIVLNNAPSVGDGGKDGVVRISTSSESKSHAPAILVQALPGTSVSKATGTAVKYHQTSPVAVISQNKQQHQQHQQQHQQHHHQQVSIVTSSTSQQQNQAQQQQTQQYQQTDREAPHLLPITTTTTTTTTTATHHHHHHHTARHRKVVVGGKAAPSSSSLHSQSSLSPSPMSPVSVLASKRQMTEEESPSDNDVNLTKKQRKYNPELHRKEVFHAVYLDSLTSANLKAKLAELFATPLSCISEIHVQGPFGIHILLTDDVVRNMKDHTQFIVEVHPVEDKMDEFHLLLKKAE